MRLFCCCLCLLLAGAAATPAPAQGFSIFNNRNHPELDWQVAETEHFEIVYPQRIAGIEAEAAAVAEASYSVLSELMGVDFGDDKIRVFLSDEDEIANGVAYPIGRAGYTAIWVHVNDTAEIWTGDVKWMRKVLAHELVHLFHYRAVRSKIGLLQELFARPLPRAWTEGLAQYLTERWDAQRGDRYLRTAVLEGRLSPDDGLSPDAGRLLYAIGNSQVRRMAEQYGDSTIAAILAHRSRPVFGIRTHDFYNAFEHVTGDRFSDFQEEWKKHVGIYYHTLAGQTERLDSLQTDPLPLPGQRIDDVQFSPDTSRVAALVLSSLARPVRRLYVMENAAADTSDQPDDAPNGRAPRRLRALKVIAEGSIEAPFAWGPQGDRIAYSRSVRGRHGSILSDLFVVDVSTGKKRRLTTNRRAHTPTFSPDGRRLAFVGMDGKTANVFLLDLATGDERQLTAFTGDVQITAARWQPPGVQGGRVEGRTGGRGEAVGEGADLLPGSTDRAGAIAIALFDAAGERTVSLVNAETGAVQPLTDRLHDDRLPVWNPAGDALAFTSLRDDAPNAFVKRGWEESGRRGETTEPEGQVLDSLSLRLLASSSPAQRVTQLFGGARVQGWLPPDSTYPSGRLLLVASETKRRDRAFLVDAGRVPRVLDRTPEAPLAYSSWTRHRPPSTIPDQIAPDASLVAARRAYRPLRNLTHVVSIAFPYYDNPDDYGLVGSTTWVEPLNKHSVALFAGLSLPSPVDESFGFLSYTNNTLAPSVTLNLYRTPGAARFYGSGLLVEDLAGGDVEAVWPLDWTVRPYTGTSAALRLRLAHAEPFDADYFDRVTATDGLPRPEAGTRFDVRGGLTYRLLRPYRYNAVYPLDGTGLRARVTAGIPALDANAFVRPDVQAYQVLPLPFGRLYVYGRATAVFGTPLAQDVVGLARYDTYDFQIPFVGNVGLGDAERVRGYRRPLIGERVAFGSAEWRFPPVLDLQTTVLGAIGFGRLVPTLFVDAAAVWNGADFGDAVDRVGLGVEVKNELNLLGFQIGHAVGLGARWDQVESGFDGDLRFDDLDLYYRVGAALPF